MRDINAIQKLMADAVMLLLLFGILIIPISSVGLLKYEKPTKTGNNEIMQVLSTQDRRLDVRETTQSTQTTESTQSKTGVKY